MADVFGRGEWTHEAPHPSSRGSSWMTKRRKLCIEDSSATVEYRSKYNDFGKESSIQAGETARLMWHYTQQHQPICYRKTLAQPQWFDYQQVIYIFCVKEFTILHVNVSLL